MLRYGGGFLVALFLAAGLLSARPASAQTWHSRHWHRRHARHASTAWAYRSYARRPNVYRQVTTPYRRWYRSGNRTVVYHTYGPRRVYVSRVAGYRGVYRRRHRR